MTRTAISLNGHPPFTLFGTPGHRSPLVFAVPHAGRAYTPELLGLARVSAATLARLEDRLADHLVHDLVDDGQCVLVAHAPRAYIDLNRDEREFDEAGVYGLPTNFKAIASAKVRGGLGLVPERLTYAGSLWRRPMTYAALVTRIAQVHRPYHLQLAEALAAARARHGTAVLVDIHSMPPLKSCMGPSGTAPGLVVGDRFGKSASSRLTDLCADVARQHGLVTAVNSPYAGNHILERHGRPDQGIHAIQLEFDRSLYLSSDLMTIGSGASRLRRVIGALARALSQELGGSAFPLAAE